MPILRRYGVADTIYFPMIKRSAVDFAAAADWTPVQSDCRIQIDAASAAYATNVVAATGSRWTLSMTAGELSGKKIGVFIIDAATKAVEDQDIEIETFGSPLAQQPFDYSVSTITLSQPAFDQLVNEVWATPSRTLSALDDKVIATSVTFKIAAAVWATPSTGQARTDIVNEVWATPSRGLSAAGNTSVADALLARNVSGGSSAGRTVSQAFHVLRNKVDARAGNVFDTDDSSVSWTFTTTTDSDTARITVVDPA